MTIAKTCMRELRAKKAQTPSVAQCLASDLTTIPVGIAWHSLSYSHHYGLSGVPSDVVTLGRDLESTHARE